MCHVIDSESLNRVLSLRECKCKFSPKKYPIVIESVNSLTELQRFWCIIYCKLSQSVIVRIPATVHTECCLCLSRMIETLARDCTTATFSTLCKAVHCTIKSNQQIEDCIGVNFIEGVLNWFFVPISRLCSQLREQIRFKEISVSEMLNIVKVKTASDTKESMLSNSTVRKSMECAITDAFNVLEDVVLSFLRSTCSNKLQTFESLYRIVISYLQVFVAASNSLRGYCLLHFVRHCQDPQYTDISLEGLIAQFIARILHLLLIIQLHRSKYHQLLPPFEASFSQWTQVCSNFGLIDSVCCYFHNSDLVSNTLKLVKEAFEMEQKLGQKRKKLRSTLQGKRKKVRQILDEDSDEEEEGGVEREEGNLGVEPTSLESSNADFSSSLELTIASLLRTSGGGILDMEFMFLFFLR